MGFFAVLLTWILGVISFAVLCFVFFHFLKDTIICVIREWKKYEQNTDDL